MRLTITSFVVLFGLMLTATAYAGDQAESEEMEPVMPPVEAAPADTPVAAPAPAPAETDESAETAEE